MSLERRKFQRVDCYLIVRNSPRAGEEDEFLGVTRNVSAGGAMIETEAQIRVGNFLEMAFLLDEDRQVWETQGTVVWSREDSGKTIFGIHFTRPLEANWQNVLEA